MITLPTLLIGFLPTYNQVGIAAPILLTLVRIWQGISLGGEYSGNIIYLAETAPEKRRAFFTSFAATGANLGILLATIVEIICKYSFSDELFKSFTWRIPYIGSSLLSLFIYWTRLNINETKIFESSGVNYSVSAWSSYYNTDSSSHVTPSGITAAAAFIIKNTTLANVNYSLAGTYTDIQGNDYANIITLPPFQSKILFKKVIDLITPKKIGTYKFQ